MRSIFTMSDLLAGKWLKCQADEPNATAQKELKMKHNNGSYNNSHSGNFKIDLKEKESVNQDK